MKFLLSSLLFFLIFCFPKNALAETKSFVTIVNPIRISSYNTMPVESLKAQYEVVSSNDLPATWLLTYEVLNNPRMISEIREFRENQEIGLFFEVSEVLCDKAGVIYDQSFSWHHAANIFLTGYVQQDRVKLIDSAFDKFKDTFGYYPKSVGAWWIDAFSLAYMQEKYGITANLGLADQYSTDGYRVWGSYWSGPFYPSKNHAGLPGSGDNKIDVVRLQWAPRDPLNGYFDSYYSTQDYLQGPVNENTSYFEKLVKLYTSSNSNKFGHVVVGLEGDLEAKSYGGEFLNQMRVIKKLTELEALEVVTMSEFADLYKSKFPDGTPVHFIESLYLLEKDIKTYWYQSTKYRVGISYDLKSHSLDVFDFRIYQKNFQEPYYFSPNKDYRLLIDIPSVIDKFALNNSWTLNLGELIGESYKVSEFVNLGFSDGEIEFKEDGISVKGLEEIKIPNYISRSPLISIQKKDGIKIKPKIEFEEDQGGYVFSYLKPEVRNLLKTKKAMLVVALLILFLLGSLYLLVRSKLGFGTKLLMLLALLVGLGELGKVWAIKNSIKYSVSQAEIDALNHLSLMDPGTVLVYDSQCLGCNWNSLNKPAAYDNLRNYVGKFSDKKIVYNKSVFEAENQETARNEFDKTGAKYIYVVNYERYIEKVPFSPGDLGIELAYENANAQVWRKVNEK